jgi:hypothetical protein
VYELVELVFHCEFVGVGAEFGIQAGGGAEGHEVTLAGIHWPIRRRRETRLRVRSRLVRYGPIPLIEGWLPMLCWYPPVLAGPIFRSRFEVLRNSSSSSSLTTAVSRREGLDGSKSHAGKRQAPFDLNLIRHGKADTLVDAIKGAQKNRNILATRYPSPAPPVRFFSRGVVRIAAYFTKNGASVPDTTGK